LKELDNPRALENRLTHVIQAFMTRQKNARAGSVNFHLRLAGFRGYLDDCVNSENHFCRTVRQDLERTVGMGCVSSLIR
jgi:hypothetical protein